MQMTQTSYEINGFKIPEFAKTVTPTKKRKWKCPLPTLKIDEYEIVPLTSSKQLKSEGYHMNNCCKDYTHQCSTGEYCIFSIRNLNGDRVATLGAINDDGYWQFDQCLGQSNSNVIDEFTEHVDSQGKVHLEWSHTELYYAANEIIRLLNTSKIN